jgi:group I intron endonuclease
MIDEIKKIKIEPTLKKGFVYCAFNKVNEKIYIGYTTQTLKKRIAGHYCGAKNNNVANNYFKNALLKYSKDTFEWFILWESDDLQILLEKEKYFVSLLKSNVKSIGYNLTSAGDSGVYNDEVRKKISDKAIERNLKGSRNPFYGKNHSQETKDEWSKVRKGICYNPGYKHSDEVKKRLSEIRIQLCKDEEHILKMQNCQVSKRIICVETGIEYKSIKEASRQTGIKSGSISANVNGRTKTCNGFLFKLI